MRGPNEFGVFCVARYIQRKAFAYVEAHQRAKKALIERHIISLNLANNDSSGAVIVEGDTKYGGISVMVNEEDHIREQCVVDGFNLAGAFERLHRYDVNLIKSVPVAYDEQLGF